MQTLRYCSSVGDSFEVPQFASHLGATSYWCTIKSNRRSRVNLGIVDSIRYRRNCLFLASKCLLRLKDGVGCTCRSSHFDLAFGVSFGHHSSKGMCFALGWALDEQEIGDGIVREESRQADTDSRETQGEDIDNKRVRDALPLNEDEIIRDTRIEVDRKGECVEEKKGQVDVRGLGRSLQLAQSVEDVEVVLRNMDKLPLQVFSTIIKGFGRDKKLEPAMAIVNWLKKKHAENDGFEGPNVFIYNSLLGAVKLSKQFDKVEIVMTYMHEAGVSPNVVTYNTLMGIYLDEGRALEALNLFEDIQIKGISLSSASYYAALLAYRSLEDGNGVLKLFVSLREKYVNGELVSYEGEDWESELANLKSFTGRICYQVMRRWLAKGGNFTTCVLKLLIEMDEADLSPSQEGCERLILACNREEHSPVAQELYSRIRERHYDISLSICNHIIWLLGKSKKWWSALEIYDDMINKGPNPNNLSCQLIISHFNVLLGVARRRRIWSWGINLLNIMEKRGLKPGTRELNSVLIACSKASETNGAIQIFKRMIETGEKPTVVSYGALLSALEKGKLYDEAIRVWEHMLKVGIRPNLYVYTVMATVYAGLSKFNLVDQLIGEMVTTKNHPTVVTFNAIICACAKNGLGGMANEWFERMKAMKIAPNEITYNAMIDILAKDGKAGAAYDMYLRAVNESLSLSSVAYDTVIQSSDSFGVSIDAITLGPRPPEKKMKKKNVVHRNNFSESSSLGDGLRGEVFDKLSFVEQEV